MKLSKELLINVVLAFVAGFITTFGAFLQATPKAPDKAATIAAASAALWAGIRLAYGVISANVPKVPTLPVDE